LLRNCDGRPIIGEGDEREGAGSFVSTEEYDFVAQVGVVHLGQGGVAELKTGFQRHPRL
jgi:hypothetical protein